METSFFKFCTGGVAEFKSYYVVWKPGTGKQNNKSGIKV